MAGCTAGLTAVLTLHPLDVVKTRLQGAYHASQEHPSCSQICSTPLISTWGLSTAALTSMPLPAVQDGVAGALPTYFGTRDALFRIFQDEGWRALYAGIAPALLGAGELCSSLFQRRSGQSLHALLAASINPLTAIEVSDVKQMSL